jgi:energy-coupling factor transporter transmembrane protein EcfT
LFLFLGFAALSLSLGLVYSPAPLAMVAGAILLYLCWPAPSARPLRQLLLFAPLLALLPLLHALSWRGLEGAWRWPWTLVPGGWIRGLLAAARLALWILLAARILDRLRPADLMARLPRRPALARLLLSGLLAFSWLELIHREAWLLERAWRARLRGGEGPARIAVWPRLMLPLFRNLIARGDQLADSLAMRRFPLRWAGRPQPALDWRDAPPAALALAVLAWSLWRGRSLS